MHEIEYRVFTEDNTRYQNGERIDIETTPQWSLYEGPSLDDARAAMNGYKLDPCEVVPVKRGMDTVCYESVRLEVWEWNEDWDDWDYLMGFDEERLPDDYEEVIKAHDKQERQYWAWLDYQRDDYEPLNMILGRA